jgi:hypothetical protein
MTTNPSVSVRVLHFRDIEVEVPRFHGDDRGPARVDADVLVINGDSYEFHILRVDGSRGYPAGQRDAIECALSWRADELLATEAA